MLCVKAPYTKDQCKNSGGFAEGRFHGSRLVCCCERHYGQSSSSRASLSAVIVMRRKCDRRLPSLIKCVRRSSGLITTPRPGPRLGPARTGPDRPVTAAAANRRRFHGLTLNHGRVYFREQFYTTKNKRNIAKAYETLASKWQNK